VIYSFEVLPPWYRAWWAYIIYASTLIFLLYSIYKNRILSLEKQQAKQLQTVLATQEEERKRISRDLHDDVGTKLSALKLFLSSLKTNVEKRQYHQIDQLAVNSEQLINETIKDVREMLLNLSPGILEEFGFTTAIESLITKINQTNTIHFNLLVFGIKQNLKKEYELALYRITQELINNVLKHSEAKNVSLQIGQRDEKIIIMIEDDGKGFDLGKHKDGYGLKNLEARTKLLSGIMNIDSQIGKGTSVAIEVPYKFM
jgi:signal transduction histidine kinase